MTPLARAGGLWCNSLTYDATSLPLVFGRVGEHHVVRGIGHPSLPVLFRFISA